MNIETISWWSRIKNSLVNIIVGIGLVIVTIGFIFWNENQSIKTKMSLLEAEKIIVQVPHHPIDENNNQKLVYTSGIATTKEDLVDDLLNVELNAIKLQRTVEMLQWKENTETTTTNNTGGYQTHTTNYTYKQEWSSKVIDSSNFQNPNEHQNPQSMPAKSLTQTAKTVTLGDFILNEELISIISNYEDVTLEKDDVESVKETLSLPASLVQNEIYVGKDPSHPQIGDLKIRLSAVYPEDVSVIAVQAGNQFEPYHAKAGDDVMLLDVGQVSATQMIENALLENKILCWIIRTACLIVLIVGYAMILNPLVVVADVLPFLGSLVGFGTGFLSVIAGLSTWGMVTAIAWFAVRPIFSLSIIGITVFVIALMSQRKKRQLENEPVEHKNTSEENQTPSE
jgi:hypothetical protein